MRENAENAENADFSIDRLDRNDVCLTITDGFLIQNDDSGAGGVPGRSATSHVSTMRFPSDF